MSFVACSVLAAGDRADDGPVRPARLGVVAWFSVVARFSVIEASGFPDCGKKKILFPGAAGTGVNGESEDRMLLRISAGVQFNVPTQSHAGTSSLFL